MIIMFEIILAVLLAWDGGIIGLTTAPGKGLLAAGAAGRIGAGAGAGRALDVATALRESAV